MATSRGMPVDPGMTCTKSRPRSASCFKRRTATSDGPAIANQSTKSSAIPAVCATPVLYLREHSDMRAHTRTGVAHTAGIADDFVDWFAIAGPSEVAVRRLKQLGALGLEFVHVIPGSTGMPREVA